MLAVRTLWTPTSRLYNRGDEGQPHKFVQDIGISWQNYRDDTQEWQPIDLNPVLVPGGYLINKVPYEATILTTGERIIKPDRFGTRLVRFPATRLLFGLQFQPVAANTIGWENAKLAIHIRWENSRVKFELVLKSPPPRAWRDEVVFDIDSLGMPDAEAMALLSGLIVTDSTQPEPISRPLAVSLVAGTVSLGFDLTGMVFPVTIDPTLDLQVGAAADDGRSWSGYDTGFQTAGHTTGVQAVGIPEPERTFRAWSRFTGVSGLSGSTIDVAYISLYEGTGSLGSPLTKIYADDQTAPTAPTTQADHAGRTKTTAGVDHDGNPTDNQFNNSPSIITVIQELADSYDPTVIQILHEDDGSDIGTDVDSYINSRSYDNDTTQAPKLHIEYTEAAGGGQPYTARTQNIQGMRMWGGF